MGTFLQIYQSSIGKKFAVGLTGLFLCSFLVVHLGINLFLFVNDGGETFNLYADFMGTNPLLKILEIVLAAAFLLHIVTTAILWLKNRAARPQPYAMRNAAAASTLASRITFLTGSLVLFFLVVHLKTFWFGSRFSNADNLTMYQIVMRAFANPLYDLFYIVALVLLAYHLRHGFQSAFQTFGIKHQKYARLIELVAILFWFVIPLAFAAMPLYFFWLHYTTGGIV